MNARCIFRNSVAVPLAAFALGVLVQCGGDGGGGNSPVQPSPSVTGVALVGVVDMMKTGASADLVLQATYSNGATERMSGTWNSSNGAVVQVSNGRVTALGPGEAVISAECQHGRATASIRVVPDYQGSWSGAYQMQTCNATGDFAREDLCDFLDIPSVSEMALRLTQNRAEVTGTIVLGGLSGDAQGAIAVPGELGLNGSVRYQEDGVTVTIAISDWNTLASGTQMTGRFVQNWTATGAGGSMQVVCALQSVTRTSAALRALPAPGTTNGATLMERAIARLRASGLRR
jgi:hypothetical protein